MGYFDYKQRKYGVYYPPESTPFAVHQIEDVLMNGPTLPFHCFIFVDVEPSRVQVGAPQSLELVSSTLEDYIRKEIFRHPTVLTLAPPRIVPQINLFQDVPIQQFHVERAQFVVLQIQLINSRESRTDISVTSMTGGHDSWYPSTFKKASLWITVSSSLSDK
jgi:hypothetical protein